MFIVITTISIFVISGLIWILNQTLSSRICLICAGVSGTWLWMLAAKFLGYEIPMIIPAMLMGGSVVGIAYQVEKHLPDNRSPLVWKILFIPTGFIAIYSLISTFAKDSADKSSWWAVFIITTIFLVVVTLSFSKKPHRSKPQNNKMIEKLKKKMKDCC